MQLFIDCVYQSLILALRKLEAELEFARHDKFGWLTMCPSNIGTALHCIVRMKLNKPTDYLNEIFEQFQVVVTLVTDGECAENECVVDICNKPTFGLSEFDCVKTVYYGVKEIIRRNSTSKTNVGPAHAEANEDAQETVCDEPQAEISLNSIQSNGTYTKEQVESECAAAPVEVLAEAEADKSDVPIQRAEDEDQNAPYLEQPSTLAKAESTSAKEETPGTNN